MKIDKPSKPEPVRPVSGGQAQDRANKSGNKPQQSAVSGTSTDLGSTTVQLKSMEASMANTPATDPAKVAKIKQAINEGRFQVDTSVVADRLIETARELINAHKR